MIDLHTNCWYDFADCIQTVSWSSCLGNR